MPPVEMLLALSDLYGITINELVNGERIAPEDLPAKAEEALTVALKDAPFHLHERQRFWRNKWNREHRGYLVLYLLGMGVLLVAALLWKPLGLVLVSICAITSVIAVGLINNAREGYVEHHLYDE